MTTFACFACGSPAFTIDGALNDDTQVTCADCDVTLGSWMTVRQQLQARLAVKNAQRPLVPVEDHNANLHVLFARR